MLVDQDLLLGMGNGHGEAVSDLLTVLEVRQTHNGVADTLVLFGFQLTDVLLQGVGVNFAND